MRWMVKLGIVPSLVLMLTVAGHAEPVSQLHPTGYINDFAHVLDPGTLAQMKAICEQVDQKAHAQIALVTINSLDGADAESYAVDLFKSWGVGSKSTNRGVLILYAIKDHRARIEVGYGLEPILPDGKVGGFQREAIPLMRSGNYSAALLLVTNRVAGVIAQDAGIAIPNVPPPPANPPPDNPQHLSLGAIFLFGIILLIVLFTPLRGILFWFLLSQGFGGRSGGWGGGGFGGGGGGGFGGFGGGSSGGGGASSSW